LGAAQSRIFENLGLALEAATMFAEADQAYRKAVATAGGAWRPNFAYGRFLFKQGRITESLSQLIEAFRVQPNDWDVRFEYARALYHTGKLEEALAVVRHAPSSDCRLHNLIVKLLSLRDDHSGLEAELKILQTCGSGVDLI